MVLFAIVEFTLSIYAWDQLFREHRPYYYNDYSGLFVSGMSVDFCITFALRFVVYLILINNWEGYQSKNGLKCCQYLFYLLSTSIIPYFDLVIHLGYHQIGFKKIGTDEPFPVDFNLPQVPRLYKGYRKETRGGHFYFLSMGYARFMT